MSSRRHSFKSLAQRRGRIATDAVQNREETLFAEPAERRARAEPQTKEGAFVFEIRQFIGERSMRKIICLFLGHKWRESLFTQKCARCGKAEVSDATMDQFSPGWRKPVRTNPVDRLFDHFHDNLH